MSDSDHTTTGDEGVRGDNQTAASHTCLADGGVDWTDLTGFQRDLLKAIRLVDDDTIPTGKVVKSQVQSMYGEDINHGRLYQNLNQLVDQQCIEKRVVDGRTYSYYLTEDAVCLLDDTAQEFVETCDIQASVSES